MKKTLFLTLAVSAMMLAACNNEDLGYRALSNQSLSVQLPQEEAKGRTVLNGLQVVWNTEDAISVFAENGTQYTNNEGKITTGVGETDANFSVTLEGTKKVAAAYPYESTNSYDGSTISMTMKDNYTYTENGIGGAPMAALITDQNALIAFKNAGALMGLTVNNIPIGYNKAVLTSKGDQAITGTCEITFDNNGNPTLKATQNATGKTITINFTAAQTLTNKTFYFPIPVGEYTSLEFSIGNGTESKVLKTKALNAARSIRYKSTLTLDEVTGSTPVDATGAEDATNKLAAGSNHVNVTITESETNPTISLPNSEGQTFLSFESIPTGKTVTIKATTEEATVSDKVVIYASSDENSSNSFDINLPNSTVTLGANGELATYGVVTAATAENTLIINNSVTVKTLKVKKGHVRVHGKIENISREENSDKVTYIIKEEGAEIPESITDKSIKVISAAEYDLISIFKKGGTQTITLKGDVELTQPLTLNDANANITIDLGTYNLTNKTAYDYDNCGETECYVFEVQAGTLNISGTGSVNAIGGSDYDMAVFANANGVVNISGGKFTNEGKANDGSDLIYARDYAAITISGGEFEAGNKSSDVGNQYVALNIKDKSEASITVTGGKFHKFNPAYNVSENPKKNFADNNTMVAVSGTEGNEIYDVIDLSDGYTMTSDIKIATPITINTTGSINFNLGTYSLTNETAYDYDNCGETECYVFEVQAGTLNISGTGSVNAIGCSDYDMAVFANTSGVVNINGGKFTNTGKENDGSDLIYARDHAAITISGGEFEAGNKSSDVGNQYVALNIKDNSEASITVTGGKFHKFNPAYNVSENPKKNFADNNTMVAVSGTEGNEIYDVIDLSDGYTMTSDIKIATPITINTTGSINFNLGTYNLTNETAYDYDNCGETECYVFEVQAGTLNISGTGSVNAIGCSDYDMAVFANTNGIVNISSGKFTNTGKENDGSDLIYVRDNAKVTITGGEFEAGNKSQDVGNGNIYVALNLRDKDNTTASISVSGGMFKNFDPANPGTETATWNQNHTNGFVEENCSSTANGEYYVVSNAESAE